MICGVGCDIVQIGRVATRQEELAKRILSAREYLEYEAAPSARKQTFLAGRFAAKEAIFKACCDPSLLLSKIEVLNDDTGKPCCNIKGFSIHVSISHEIEYAIAYAVCEYREN